MRIRWKTGPARLLMGFMLLLAALAPGAALAAWPPDGRPACEDVSVQGDPAITSDGAGGALVAWVDLRSAPAKIAVQHVFASGDIDPVWPHFGRTVVGNPDSLAGAFGGQFHAALVPDGAGGAIIAWQDDRSAVTETDVYAKHILADGKADEAWPANGTGLAVIAGLQDEPVAVTDGAGGAIVAWMDTRPGASVADVYAQHVLASGLVDPLWPVNGLAVGTAPGAQEFPAIVQDGVGGAVITWFDRRNGVTGFDVYAQHVLTTGTVDPTWPADGRALCTAAGEQVDAAIVSDNAGGAVVSWTDGRVAGETHIFAQHVLASGAIDAGWPVDGRAVSGASLSDSRSRIVGDGAGGAIVTWQAFVDHGAEYAQHVTRAGVVDPGWPAGGRALSVSSLDQANASAVSDDAGGAIVSWESGGDIFAQHVMPDGILDPAYPVAGRVVCGDPNIQSASVLVGTGAGGAIAAWADTRRASTSPDIYAMQVLNAITTGVSDEPAPVLAFAHTGPNPARGPVMMRFTLPHAETATLAVYDVRGRLVRRLASGPRAAGAHAIAWDLRDDRGQGVGSGFYFGRLEADGRTFTTKISALR